MADLFVAFGMMVALAAVLFALALRAGKRLSLILVLGALGAGGLHFFLLHDNPLLARWFPVSNIVVLGNCVPLIAAVLAALVWRHLRLPSAVRAGLAAALVLLSFDYAAGRLFSTVAVPGGRWRDDTCLQSTEYTCAPAAASTLLHTYGIEATEQEMAGLCLTNGRGTSNLGLYRGLCLKTRGHSYTPTIVCGPPEGSVADMPTPALLAVKLSMARMAELGCRWVYRCPPGIEHAIVLLGRDEDGQAIVADPLMGRLRWRAEVLEAAYQNVAYHLVPDGSNEERP